MSQLSRKRVAAELDGSLAPAEEEDPLMASARSTIRTITNKIRCETMDIEFEARFIVALEQLYGSDLVEEFFETLQGNSEISSVTVEVFSCDTNDFVYERLGRALGTILTLSCLKISLLDGKTAIERAASILTHIRQVRDIEWIVPQGHAAHADDSSSATDTAFSSLAAALDGNKSIKRATLHCKSRTDLVAGVCRSMTGLLCLTDITLYGSVDATVTLEDAISMSEVFQVKSLRSLDVNHVSFADTEAASIFSQAIAQSALAKLSICLPKMNHGVDHTWIPLFITRVLTSSHLRRLQFSRVIFLEYDLAVAFCRALAGSQVPFVRLFTVQLHADAINFFGRSICSPFLKTLAVENLSDTILDSIGTSLNSAPNLQVLQIRLCMPTTLMSENTAVRVLHGCTHCPNIVELRLGGTKVWTALMDEAAAECTRHCGKLVTIKLGDSYDTKRSFNASPAFLAACQAHRVVEEIGPPTGCPQLRAALALVTAKNKETRVYRSRFESLAGDRHGRAVFSRVVDKVKDKPHLIFLALTSNKHIFSG